MQSKLVDYAIVMEPTADMNARVNATLAHQVSLKGQRVVASIKSTSAEWIRFRPIAVSIETKRYANYQDSGELQLGSWAIAHLLKLKQFL